MQKNGSFSPFLPRKKNRIQYKPVSLRELLAKMKDETLLMIDLAYSAVLFRNKEIAEEVMKLEEDVDGLTYLVGMNTMLAARDADDAEALEPILKIANATDRMSNAAADISQIAKFDSHPYLFKAIRESEEPLIRAIVSNPKVKNKKIGQLKIRTETGCDIIAIRRGSLWIFDPDKDTKLRLEDIVLARGTDDGNTKLCDLLGGKCTRGETVKDDDLKIFDKEDLEKIEAYMLNLINKSGLMVDLGFSAILFNSKEIAEDVLEMEEEVDRTHLEFEQHILSTAKTAPHPERLLGFLQLSKSIEEISDSASEIAEIVIRGLEPHPILDIAISESDEVISRVQVERDSKIADKKLEDSMIQESGGRIIAIKREGDWIYKFRKDAIIVPNDILIIIGPREGEKIIANSVVKKRVPT